METGEGKQSHLTVIPPRYSENYFDVIPDPQCLQVHSTQDKKARNRNAETQKSRNRKN